MLASDCSQGKKVSWFSKAVGRLPEGVELIVDDGGIVYQDPVSVFALLVEEDWDSPSQLVCDDDNVGDGDRWMCRGTGDIFRFSPMGTDDIFPRVRTKRIKIDILRKEINHEVTVTRYRERTVRHRIVTSPINGVVVSTVVDNDHR